MKNVLQNLIKRISPQFWQYLVRRSKRCEKCNSKHLVKGYWVRGWNNLCEQACGDEGERCFDCGNIVWEKSCEQYKAILPHWCKAYCANLMLAEVRIVNV